jgi:hypothetical protein
MLYYYNAQRYRFVIVLSIFSDFYAPDAVFRPFRATKRPLGLKIIHSKVLEMTLPEPKVVKMGYANMLSAAGFIRPNPGMFLVYAVGSGQHRYGYLGNLAACFFD